MITKLLYDIQDLILDVLRKFHDGMLMFRDGMLNMDDETIAVQTFRSFFTLITPYDVFSVLWGCSVPWRIS